MTGLSTSSPPENWYFAGWSASAWLETVVKSIALLVAFRALFNAIGNDTFIIPSGAALIQSIILFILALGLVAAIFDRLRHREITSMIFVIFNNIGHWGMLTALFFFPFPRTSLLLFSGFMLIGDLIKLVEIYLGDLQMPGTSQSLLYGLTTFYVFSYALLLLISIFS